jgi:hypothetical protein
MTQAKKKNMYVTKLKKGQVVKTAKSEFTVKEDEISIYVPEDVTLKAGDKLYLNPVKNHFDRLAANGSITEEDAEKRIQQCQEYNQPYIVSIYSKNK